MAFSGQILLDFHYGTLETSSIPGYDGLSVYSDGCFAGFQHSTGICLCLRRTFTSAFYDAKDAINKLN